MNGLSKHTEVKIPIVIIIYQTLLLLIPELWLSKTHPWYEPFVGVAISAFFYGGFVLAFNYFKEFIGLYFGRLLKAFVGCIGWLIVCGYFISQSFLWFAFHRHWDSFTLQLVKETTQTESTEFLLSFVNTMNVWIFLMLFIVLTVSICYFSKRSGGLALHKSKLAKTVVFTYILLCFAQLFFISSDDATTNYERAAGMPFKRTALFNIRQSVLQMKEYEEENEKCAQVLASYNNKKVYIPEDAPDVILIIGESFNRHHSEIYGYNSPTNPYLKQLIEKDDLYVFTDVIAPTNGTSDCFKLFLSMASANDSVRWCDTPLLPTIFYKQGWNTVYYSNQFVCEEDLGQWDASMGFVNHPLIAKHMFSSRNHRTFDYDMQLVEEYEKNREKIERPEHNFIIFHLYGQHVNAVQRYPESESYYDYEDIKRPDLSVSQRQTIAEYDNSIRYNDKVVRKIISLFEKRDAIIIYFSDHGDEIYDYRDQYGRTDIEEDDDKALQYQLDIPFFVYLSPSFQQNNQEKIELLKHSLDNPFMTDDFPHFVLDFLGASSPWLDPSKSLLRITKDKGEERMVYKTHRMYPGRVENQ